MATAIGNLLVDYLRENGLEKPLLERQMVDLWPQVMGATVSRMTRSVEVREGVLYVRLSNAALRAQLFDCRYELVKRLNTAAGAEVLRDVRLG